MKKILLTLSLNVLFIAVSLSQTYHPLVKENVYWDVLHADTQNFFLYDQGYRFFFEGDTIILSFPLKFI